MVPVLVLATMSVPAPGVASHGLEFGRQGFGAMRLSGDVDPGDSDRDPAAVIHAALDAGVTMVDTADAYQNEELVGRVVRGRRREVLLASKFGLVWGEDVAGEYEVRADREYVRRACDASLARLGVDVIDLYYLHERSEIVPIEETVGAMSELVEAGKVRALGLSNVTADDLVRAHSIHPIAALQERWSLDERRIEVSLVPAAAATGTVIVAHSPSGHGVLHRAAKPSAGDGRDMGALREALIGIGRAHDATPGQVAIAWTHIRRQVHGVPVVPLPGTTRASHARANAAAADLALADDELAQLDALSACPAGAEG